jgi:hypothetical protein
MKWCWLFTEKKKQAFFLAEKISIYRFQVLSCGLPNAGTFSQEFKEVNKIFHTKAEDVTVGSHSLLSTPAAF